MLKWFTGNKPQTTTTAPQPAEAPSNPPTASSWWQRLLHKTSSGLAGNLQGLFHDDLPLTETAIDDIEAALLKADVGVATTDAICTALKGQRHQIKTQADLTQALHQLFLARLQQIPHMGPFQLPTQQLAIVLVVGVNGSGKTTCIGKLAHRFGQDGHPVIIAAGDTFRAAAEDQLAIWAQRANATLIRKDGGDPAAVVFDAIAEAKSQRANLADGGQAPVVIIDTAGRLQNQHNLMEELRKIRRVIDKAAPQGTPINALLVLDASTGQNALRQAEVFHQAVDLTGVILTKLDGSAKGGVIFAVAQQFNLPVQFIGTGESLTDLQPFDPAEFVKALC
jgi:fused signal recognition particle receptor